MASAELVLITLGVGSLGKGRLPASVKEVTVVRNEDPPGSPADASLWRGVARLAGQDVTVKVTPRPSEVFGRETGHKGCQRRARKCTALAGVTRCSMAAADKPDELNIDAIMDEVARLDKTPPTNLPAISWRAKLGWRRIDPGQGSQGASR